MSDALNGTAKALHQYWVGKVSMTEPLVKDGGMIPEDIAGMRVALLWLADWFDAQPEEAVRMPKITAANLRKIAEER